MTPAYKARIWKVGGRWHARRPVLAGDCYRVERKTFHLWRHAVNWTAETRPRPADLPTFMAGAGDAIASTFTLVQVAFKQAAGAIEIDPVQSDFKLAR